MTGWGGGRVRLEGNPPHVAEGTAFGTATVDGRLLNKYKDKFTLMVVMMHVVNSESYMDKSDICRSQAIRIRPEDLHIRIDFNQLFLNEMQMGAADVSYALLALPKAIKPDSFQTLNEAEDKGVQIIGTGTAIGSFYSPAAQPASAKN